MGALQASLEQARERVGMRRGPTARPGLAGSPTAQEIPSHDKLPPPSLPPKTKTSGSRARSGEVDGEDQLLAIVVGGGLDAAAVGVALDHVADIGQPGVAQQPRRATGAQLGRRAARSRAPRRSACRRHGCREHGRGRARRSRRIGSARRRIGPAGSRPGRGPSRRRGSAPAPRADRSPRAARRVPAALVAVRRPARALRSR